MYHFEVPESGVWVQPRPPMLQNVVFNVHYVVHSLLYYKFCLLINVPKLLLQMWFTFLNVNYMYALVK